MIKTGILNPAINSLLGRVRHTNTLVIADRGFSYWPNIEIIDISLIDDLPTVLDVLRAVLPNFTVGQAWMAEEFRALNSVAAMAAVHHALAGTPLSFEPHTELKRRVPEAVGLIRTGDSMQYSNIVLESA